MNGKHNFEFVRLFNVALSWVKHAIKWLLYAIHHVILRIMGDRSFIAGVRVILIRAGRVVLVEHWYKQGVWTLPGGGVKKGETPEETAKREVFEETGFTVHSFDGEVGTYRGRMGKNDSVKVFYTENFTGGLKIMPNSEIMVRGLFDLNDLPENISPANRRRIEACVRGIRGEQKKWSE